MKDSIECAYAGEPWGQAREILERIIENYQIADRENCPVCQDTGVACVFVKLGQEVHIQGDVNEAINEGVRQGYSQGYLRKSVVRDPLDRVNTGDNTPAMIYFDIVPGDVCEITVAPKGFGSENMSQVKMLKPSDGLQGVKDFVVQVVKDAGPNPCPPIVVGVGVGGTFDKAAYLAKKALMRHAGEPNPVAFYAAGTGQCHRHRPPGLRRQDHRSGCAHRAVSHPHCGSSCGSEHQLPCYPPSDGGSVIWQ